MSTTREEATERGKKKADAKAKEREAKSEKGKKGKGKGKGDSADAGRPSVANHPRARASVRRIKGIAGLVGFGIAALLAHSAGLSATSVLIRALLVGIGSYFLAWGCAVAVWRQIVLAELRMIFDLHQEHVRGLSGGSSGDGANAPSGGPANASGS
ncbi:MAG TPA: hypothetical protein VMF07_14770 [Solirubrobacteraceae bacterium]|nr:hypothetical protein [Solirubrobacteraceae bacterium]